MLARVSQLPPGRPRLAKALSAFCIATVAFLVFRDLLVAEAREVEVWLGLEVRGQAALLTAPLHWAIFAAGAWGFWRERRWIWPAAAGYALAIALSHLIWNLTSARGGGWSAGLAQAALFSVPGVLFLRARRDR